MGAYRPTHEPMPRRPDSMYLRNRVATRDLCPAMAPSDIVVEMDGTLMIFYMILMKCSPQTCGTNLSYQAQERVLETMAFMKVRAPTDPSSVEPSGFTPGFQPGNAPSSSAEIPPTRRTLVNRQVAQLGNPHGPDNGKSLGKSWGNLQISELLLIFQQLIAWGI